MLKDFNEINDRSWYVFLSSHDKLNHLESWVELKNESVWRTSDILLLAYSILIAPRSEESRKEPWRVFIAWVAQRTSWYSIKATGDPPLECIRRRENPGKLCTQQQWLWRTVQGHTRVMVTVRSGLL